MSRLAVTVADRRLNTCFLSSPSCANVLSLDTAGKG